jgi:hypothetical protein
MPWCAICRRDYSGQDGNPCPQCGNGGEQPSEVASRTNTDPHAQQIEAAPIESAPPPDPQTSSSPPRPAHLAILEQAPASSSPPLLDPSDRSPRRRLVSSAGPAVPIRKQANDSVPSTWMSRLEAAKLVTQPEQQKNGPPPIQKAGQPPPLRPQGAGQPPKEEKKPPAQVGQPAHLLVAQLEAEDKIRSDEEAQRVSALFDGDKSDEISKVEIPFSADEVKRKKIPDWIVVLVLAVIVVGVVSVVVVMTKKEPGPSAEIDPAVRAAAQKRREAIIALEEGHKLALEGKAKADEAIKVYSRALELDPLLASAERGLAIAYAAKENEEQAVEHYKSYLRLSPQATDADTVRKIVSDYEKKKKKAAEAPKEEPPPPAKTKNGKRMRHH